MLEEVTSFEVRSFAMDGEESDGSGSDLTKGVRAAGFARAAKAAAEKAKKDARSARMHAAKAAKGDAVREAARVRSAEFTLSGIDMTPEDMQGAAHCPHAALNLLWHNTGLGGWHPLFELKHSKLTEEQHLEEVELAQAALRRERQQTADAQMGIGQRYVGVVNEYRPIYVCACCGERNYESVGNFSLLSMEDLEPLRYTDSARDVERWARIERAHARVEAESGVAYSCMFNFWRPQGHLVKPGDPAVPLRACRKRHT